MFAASCAPSCAREMWSSWTTSRPTKVRSPTLWIAQAGAQVLFLPAYSPDFNPIEKMWSKVKTSLRTAEARTQAALVEAIAAALESVTRQDAINWFASCGYSFI